MADRRKSSADDLLGLDLDTNEGFKGILDHVTDFRSRNFAVRFNAASATCNVDISGASMQDAVYANTHSETACRWLNIWSPTGDECSAVRAMLQSYGVSRRLTHLLCPRAVASANPDPNLYEDSHDRPNKIEISETQKGDRQRPELRRTTTTPSLDGLTKGLWHFCSIDWGRRYACISYNALFTTARDESDLLSRQPEAIRSWSAIVLCDDGLVISIFETPKGLPPEQIKTIRKNQVNILKNLSYQYDPTHAEASIFQVHLRPSQPSHSSGANLPDFDHFAVASRLFYYLFDDWRATFELVSGRQHPYRQKLDDVRARMSKTPRVEDVEKLHQLGQQLVVLQRVYQSYEKVVDRLLQRQRHLSLSLWRTAQRSLSDIHSASRQSVGGIEPDGSTLNFSTEAAAWITEAEADQKTIRLPLGTVARFERLLDRIRLYALMEIEECIAEKESLVLMTFNLVNLKNAAAIERLTRTTILLAKVTILFLPVSLMTSYFGLSMEAIDQLYSLETYWVCFVVVGLLTTVLLLSFNMANYKVSGGIDYQGLTRLFMKSIRARRSKGTKNVREQA